ncbi:hypothetical protein [Bordetella genomosp. 1]|uniref:Uncharacterized protein n=1 Tax=Bordetella genomosp. 1 TaxID=1395607 RepID=A0ABX4EUV7_9BORD|nr:hypothetical protein [Bordetella genomosp. 1]OZI58024.1 hypothetical protein CAL27_21820 [Bordetella genomosp. 1]
MHARFTLSPPAAPSRGVPARVASRVAVAGPPARAGTPPPAPRRQVGVVSPPGVVSCVVSPPAVVHGVVAPPAVVRGVSPPAVMAAVAPPRH